MLFSGIDDLKTALRGTLSLGKDGVKVDDEAALRRELIDRLVWNAVFHKEEAVRELARWVIRGAALATGAPSASIQGLYDAMGRGEAGGFTTPALNLRGLTYDAARAAFRAALRNQVGALVLELARSEMGYTFQRPGEYAAVVLAAAVKEGWKHPVFIQGDHFQFAIKKWKSDPAGERKAIEDLTREAIAAGFLNIDIDSSTLVDLSFPTLREQQKVNFEQAAELTAFIRKLEPRGVSISVGGEIGEVGKKNSTPEEFSAYMEGYREHLARQDGGSLRGISKISIQTGTSHGGVPGPDGKVVEVKLDFGALEVIGELARKKYGMSGAVQHGASTLPEELFHKFPECVTSEIHLATGFQNLMFDHQAWPEELRERQNAWCKANCADEAKAGETEEQFLYKTRKKTYGPFKLDMWQLPPQVKGPIFQDLERKFEFLMKQLKVAGTRQVTDRFVKPVAVLPPPPRAAGGSGGEAYEQVEGE
ncbi:MAG TPA: class II fructose-bisphosphate aldolase [Polyangia bacterium]|nr:class II fructose-bisphosphate aldolase [Polyangia bacterium]